LSILDGLVKETALKVSRREKSEILIDEAPVWRVVSLAATLTLLDIRCRLRKIPLPF
jgi:hypothetical protein